MYCNIDQSILRMLFIELLANLLQTTTTMLLQLLQLQTSNVMYLRAAKFKTIYLTFPRELVIFSSYTHFQKFNSQKTFATCKNSC